MSDLENIKNVLKNYEVEYNPQDWNRLEKDLPRSSGMSSLTKIILVASAVIFTVTTAIFINNLTSNKTFNKSENKTAQSNVDQKIVSDNNLVDINNNDSIDVNEKIEPKIIQNSNTLLINNEQNINNENESTNNQNDIIEKNNTNNQNENINTNNPETSNEIKTELPDASEVTFIYKIINKCTPAIVKFEALNVPKNCKVIWNTGDNARVNGNKAEYIYIDNGTFYPEANLTFNNFIIKNYKFDELSFNNPSSVKINFDNSENLYYFTCDNEEGLNLLWTIENQEFREREVRYTFNKSADYIINLSVVNQYGCKTEVFEKVSVLIEHIFYLPNAFTPNSNGINSEFGPIGENMDFESYQLLIVDGTGKIIFSSDNVNYKWNGKINNIGENAKPDYYLWEVKTIDEFGNFQTKKGRVNLIWN
jgi:gliding motility-associated-like protein